jgi:hypothetical protein
MAEVFTNKKSRNIGTTATTIGSYTVPATKVATVIGLTVSNVTENIIKVTVVLKSGGNDFHIVKNADIIPGQSQVLVGGDQKLILLTGESISVVSNTASSVDAIMSLVEIS